MSKFASQQDYKNIESVEEEHPGAAEIVEVYCSWMVFDTESDAETWSHQE
jgi:hypothetical protein